MKIISNSAFRVPRSACGIRNSQFATRNSERGMISVIFIALLAIMMILLTANSRALLHLRREVKFMEQQQIKRLDAANTIPAAAKP